MSKKIQDKEEHPVKKEKHEDQQEGCSTIAGEENTVQTFQALLS